MTESIVKKKSLHAGWMALLVVSCLMTATACDDDTTDPTGEVPDGMGAGDDAAIDGSVPDEGVMAWEGPIIEIAARSIVDEAGHARLRPRLDELVVGAEGFVASREFAAFFSLAPDPNPVAPIRIGLGQYASVDAWQQIAMRAFADPATAAVVEEYLATIAPLADLGNVLVRPLDPAEPIDVAGMVGPGQVLEVAIRDLDRIEDEAAFFAAKDAFIDVLTAAPGVVREFEWVSATAADRYYVGMTLYESQAAFAAVAQDPAVVGGPEAMAFFGGWPPLVAQVTVPVEDVSPGPSTSVRASGAQVIVRSLPGGVRVHSYVAPVAVGANATHVIESAGALVVVDSQWFADFARDFRAYVDEIGKPIERVIVTHGHLDHYFGLSVAFTDVEVYALAATQALIAEEAQALFAAFGGNFGYEGVAGPVVPGNVLAEGELMIDGVRFRVSSVDDAESEQEVVIELVDRGAWVVGDLVYNDIHLFVEKRDVQPWITALERLQGEIDGVVLAGHGVPGGVETLAASADYLRTVQRVLAEGVDAAGYRAAMIAAYPMRGGEFLFDIFLPFLFPPDTTDDVVELAVRRLNAGQDVEAFAAARDAFVERLRALPGVGTDREFEAVFDFATFGAPAPPVFIGMTQYESADAFGAAGAALGESAEAGAFFGTFTPEVFTALRPLVPGSAVDLAGVAAAPGQVLEMAVRDLSTYAGFVADDYAAARDGFLDLLRAQPGVVAEYQWVSALDPNVVVGMTVYESFDAFVALSQSPAISEAAETAAFLGGYPPAVGYVSRVVR